VGNPLAKIRKIRPDVRAVAGSRLFDADWYRPQNARGLSRWMNPIWHYVCFGRHLDPNPLFDTDWYVAQRPDAAPRAAVPLLHFLEAGARDGADPSPHFSSWWYFRHCPRQRNDGS
jgi:hypothetical protein